MPLKILGVAGSMREGSYSTLAIKLCLDTAGNLGAEAKLLDLRTAALPLYQPDAVADEYVRDVAEAVQWADAYLLARCPAR